MSLFDGIVRTFSGEGGFVDPSTDDLEVHGAARAIFRRAVEAFCWRCGAAHHPPLELTRRAQLVFGNVAEQYVRQVDSGLRVVKPRRIVPPSSPLNRSPAAYSGRVVNGSWIPLPLAVTEAMRAAWLAGLRAWVEGRKPRHEPRLDPRFDLGAGPDCQNPLRQLQQMLELPVNERLDRCRDLLSFLETPGEFEIVP